MKLCKTEEAVGQILCHDITQIIPGVVKDAVFRKGHIIREEDIPVLLSVGKEHIYIWENDENMLHENDAADILCSICKGRKGHIIREEDIPVLLSVGKEHIYIWENDENMLHENDAADILCSICKGEGMHETEVKEGKIELIADCDGVLKIEREMLRNVNRLGEMMVASRHGDFPVKKGDKIAGTRIIPLVIEKEKMERAKEVVGGKPIFQVLPYQQKKIGLVTTGSEVYKGRIQDAFTPVIREKLAEYGMEIQMQKLSIFQVLPYQQKKIGLVTTGSEVYKGRIQDAFTPVIREKLAEYGMEIQVQKLSGDDHKQITEIIQSMVDDGMVMIISRLQKLYRAW